MARGFAVVRELATSPNMSGKKRSWIASFVIYRAKRYDEIEVAQF
jgi:hypothetical protein